jgi:hypothetical protein
MVSLGKGLQRKGSIVNRLWLSLCLVLSLLGGASPAAALPLTLTLVPSDTTLVPGQVFTVTVVIDGLSELDGDFEQEIALESFDLSLQFDTTRLAFTSLAFGSSLGDPDDAFETFLSGPGNDAGVVAMGEFSFLTEGALLALQDAPFTLATLELQASELLGATQLQLVNLGGSSLGGIGGLALGNLLVAPSPVLVTIVPEPGVAALGLVALALLARRARAAQA